MAGFAMGVAVVLAVAEDAVSEAAIGLGNVGTPARS